jgi:haloalkane dehalogenase
VSSQQSPTISAEFPYEKKRLQVLGREMAYVEVGQGDPIVLLHGNPTSSYLWRNVLPYLEPLGRCIAPDLIGMGDSDKLPNSGPGSYRFVEHRRYLDALLEGLGVRERVTLVVHDWGSGLGFDWANRRREAVRGIAYMEAILRPPGWELPEQYQQMILMARTPAGEAMALEQPFYEQVLTSNVLRQLSEAELAEYRRPFANPGEDRRPTLSWARENPVHGEPADVAEIVKSYSEWLARSSVPKLLVRGEPGAGITGSLLDFCRTWNAQREVTVRGLHFLQEDSPHEIGRAIADWLASINSDGLSAN